MARTEILAPTTGADDSASFTVDVLTGPTSIYLFSGEADESFMRIKCSLLKEVDTTQYQPYYAFQGRQVTRNPVYLTNTQRNYILQEPGTYIVRKPASVDAIGIAVDDGV